MPESKPNPIARVLAVAALVVVIALVILTVATSGGDDSNDNGGDDTVEKTGPTAAGQRALEDGIWVVDEGDTFVSISEETGVELDQLVELNPDIDPQAVIPGQRIALRTGVDASGKPASPTGVGAGGPTDSPSSSSGSSGSTGTDGSSSSDDFGSN